MHRASQDRDVRVLDQSVDHLGVLTLDGAQTDEGSFECGFVAEDGFHRGSMSRDEGLSSMSSDDRVPGTTAGEGYDVLA